MNHQISPDDDRFRQAFEALHISAQDFDHAAHVRLAYIYLCEDSIDGAVGKMRAALLAFLAHLGVEDGKYHETITRAWVMAVHHFMTQSPPCASAADLLRINPQLRDSQIMLTHYSAEVLFSITARHAFVEPDIQPIPPRGVRPAN